MLTNLRDAFRGQSMSPNIVPFHMLGIVSYCAILTLSLRRAVFTIFDFKKCRDLEMGQRSLSLRVVSFDRWCMVSYLCSLVTLSLHRFLDIRLQKCHDLENRVRGPSRSLEMSPCDGAHTPSYWRSVVTMALFFWDIQCRIMSWPWSRGQRSLKVIESCTIRRSCIVSYKCSLVTLSLKRTVFEIFDL